MPKWIDPDESSSGPSVSLGTLANATKMENSSIHAEFTAVQTYFSVTTCPTDQRITSRGVGRQFSRICLWKQKEGQTSYKEKKKKKDSICLYGLWDPLPLCSSEVSADDSPMRKKGTSLVSYSWWRVCKSMWRANEQESRARLGLWKEGRERFKILNGFVSAFDWANKHYFHCIGCVCPQNDKFCPQLSLPKPFHHCCPDHCFSLRVCCGKFSLLRVQVRKTVA